jgi:Flp pilus assembly protein TadG
MRNAHITAGLLTNFASDKRAAVGIMFGLSVIPLMALVGAGVDYSMAASTRTRLQAASDTTALAVAQQASKLSDSDLLKFANNMVHAEMGGAAVNVDALNVSDGRTTITIKTSGIYYTGIMGLVGVHEIPVSVTSRTVITNNTYEIAMVMDNSGSMASTAGGKSKMDAAKDAAKQLVNIMFTSSVSATRTKISLVPFTLSVKVGAGYQNATWMDSTGSSSIAWQNLDKPNSSWTAPKSRFDLFSSLNVTWGGCVESRPGAYGVSDAPPVAGVGDSLFVPQFAPDEPGPASSSTNSYAVTINKKKTTYTYNNSYIDDTSAQCTSTNDKATDTSSAWNYANKEQVRLCKYRNKPTLNVSNSRGPNWNCDAKPLSRMSDSTTDLNKSIDAMAAAGNTDLLEGFTWGWRTISPNAPFSDGRAYNTANNNKVIVLLTDGMNAWNSASNHNYGIYSPFGYYWNNRLGTGATDATAARAQLDTKTLAACNNAKAQGITIYTVGFSVAGDPIDAGGLALLQNCASSPRMSYVANNSSDIVKVFTEIAHNIGGLRITM